MVISLRPGMEIDRDELLRKLMDIRYERNDINFVRNTFRVRGDTVEIYPAYWTGRAIRVEFFGDEIDRISEINAVTGVPERMLSHVAIYPASPLRRLQGEDGSAPSQDIERGAATSRSQFFEEHDKLLEAQRIAPAHAVRHRNAAGDRLLHGHRELFPRTIAGRAPGTAALHAAGLLPRRFPAASSTRAT